jgi:hypothetical protein
VDTQMVGFTWKSASWGMASMCRAEMTHGRAKEIDDDDDDVTTE